jgi:alkanesulfonate monooxygenase SsuD/methylene tetrahydromethanopterin reductase-like flavin-dependent oxidoreductase (luciferase family)
VPVQERLPVLVAGSGERRTLRTVAQYADVWHTWGTPESFAAKGKVLDERCAEMGRDPSEIRRATGFFVEDLSDGAATVAPFREVCDEFVFGDVGATPDELVRAVRAAIG